MIEKIKSKMISRRRAFSLVGLPVAFGLASAPTVVMSPEAEAQTARGQARRTNRQKGCAERHSGRATQGCFGFAGRRIARRIHLGCA